ncbi:MAG: hypothetical protein LPK02_15625 [Rhodobacterales bacterium]|nr:hypothetical protein [Rhodobacterales bacterium]
MGNHVERIAPFSPGTSRSNSDVLRAHCARGIGPCASTRFSTSSATSGGTSTCCTIT